MDLTQIREIYKDRAALEKEYATKLATLAKRASEKRNKRIASLVVGDEPSKTLDDAALRMRYDYQTTAYNLIVR